ncbi:unnamed protein product [Brassica rapa subsp. narinosa]
MGDVISTATNFVVEKLCSCFWLEVHHICRLDKNVKTLVEDMKKLEARRDDVLRFVRSEEDEGLERLSGVDVWLTAVGNIEKEARETLMACTSDGCSRKLVARFRLGKKVFSMLKDVKELTDRKLTEDVNALAVPPVRKVVRKRDLEQNIVGQETLLESAWSRLMDEGTKVMGLYGMGGVGKTTLLDQLSNKFCGANDGVDIVIWVVVSKVKRNEKIQDEIAEKLGIFEGESWKHKTEDQKAYIRYTVQAGAGLRDIPEVESWGPVRKMSLMYNEIKELSGSPCCPVLTTLLLQKNKMVTISSEFFRRMPRLLVLDLSRNTSFNGLPEKMSLVALRYLDLSGTRIERLPVGLQESRMLICLDLEFTMELDNVSGISKFSRLRRLGLWHSKTKLDMSLLEELQLLKYLQVVTIGISSCLVAEKLSSYDRVVKCINKLVYADLLDESFIVLTLPTMVDLCNLIIESCGMMEIKTEGATSLWNRSPMSPSFLNLSTVGISYCNGLKDLTWLLFAPNLAMLYVGDLTEIEYIISQEKATNGVTEKEAGSIVPFASLKYFTFDYLPMLKSIYWSSLPFQCLKEIKVQECPNLRKLPLDSKNSKSCGLGKTFTIQCNDENWIKSIQWKDQATKARFKSCCLQFVSSLLELARFRPWFLEWLYNLVVKYIQNVIISELQEKSFRVLTLPANGSLLMEWFQTCHLL